MFTCILLLRYADAASILDVPDETANSGRQQKLEDRSERKSSNASDARELIRTEGGTDVPFLLAAHNTARMTGESMTVSWSGISTPTEFDWIGVYSPANASDRDFVHYVRATTAGTWALGFGSFELPLWNFRGRYSFRYFSVAAAVGDSLEEDCRQLARGPLLGNCSQTLYGQAYRTACCDHIRTFLQMRCMCSGAAQDPFGELMHPMQGWSTVSEKVVEFRTRWADRAVGAVFYDWVPCASPAGGDVLFGDVLRHERECLDPSSTQGLGQ
ncbi:hypothetical protein CYMTET_35247, partial [Cymbomonas tetramitiformis]